MFTMSFRLRAYLFTAVFLTAFAADTAGPRFERLMMGAVSVPVVKDTVTGLMWQGCPAGMTGDAASCTGTAATYYWSDANNYCSTTLNGDSSKNAGFTDWYLPDIKEIRSILDNRYSDPAVNQTFFHGTPISYFWSSSSYAPDSGMAWNVNFDDGNVEYNVKNSYNYVRCVRRM